MNRAAWHLNDVELVLSLDGELSPSHAARVSAHLSTCERCSARRDEFAANAIGITLHSRKELDAALPSDGISRARLRLRMAEAAANEDSRAWWRVPLPVLMQSAAVLCGVFLLGAATAKWIVPTPITAAASSASSVLVAPSATTALENDSTAEPNHALTPGAVRDASLADVCAMPHEEVEVDVPAATRSAVFQEYGITGARPADYEIDYLIAPGLGGSEDIHNLWPEPYATAAWNARAKDSLEEYLHESVCAGKLDLHIAQADISHDWIAAYKKYFHTDQPLPASAKRDAPAKLAPEARSFAPVFLVLVDSRDLR
jgi:anti-sigma factor RsiW